MITLVTSPRLPAGLLTAAAWDLLRAHPVFAPVDTVLVQAVRAAGIPVTIAPTAPTDAVWLGDPPPGEPVVVGSWDPPGAHLLDLVEVMDRLHAVDPWRRQQTHQTLARYLLEEAYEAYDAMDAGDLDALREELGDVLMQVVLHARMAQDATPGWTVDDVADGIAQKLIRRNPHVFAGLAVADVDEVMRNWERIKQEEKQRTSPVEGVALAQGALALATALVKRAGAALTPPPGGDAATLWALVTDAVHRGVDLEAELRRAALAAIDALAR